MNTSPHNILPERKISRDSFLLLLYASIDCKAYRFSRQAALTWLAAYPGDLGVKLLLAQSYLGEGKQAQAKLILAELFRLDPEFKEASIALILACDENDQDIKQKALANALGMGSKITGEPKLVSWGSTVMGARKALENGQVDDAETLVHQAMASQPESALAAVVDLQAAYKKQDDQTVLNLANLYHKRWPECLQFSLVLADKQLKLGNEIEGVELLHQCAANDAAGQVPARLWGVLNPYRGLWPESLSIIFSLPVPSQVAAVLGWNKLPSGLEEEQGSLEETPRLQATLNPQNSEEKAKNRPLRKRPKNEELIPVQKAFEKLSKKLKRPGIGSADGRYPMYVILSSIKALQGLYGDDSLDILDQEMNRLSTAVKRHPGWGSIVFYPDSEDCMTRFGLEICDVRDSWQVKLALADLDQSLESKGERIGAVLIVGGADIIPFHHLPNPTNDIDEEVLSDNPYASLDGNYFIPEWPVGRLPGEYGADAGLLLQQLRQVVRYHTQMSQFRPWWKKFWHFLFRRKSNKKPTGSGLTAAVWRRSSLAVFRPVGEGRSLLVCPPEYSGTFSPTKLTKVTLGYYNLHGLEDAGEWYGQKDIVDAFTGPDYPVALSPKDLTRNGKAPKVVFSEACYGGFVLKKKEDEALSLRFLSIGTQAVVGSTCIAYGSINTPLLGADLLGYLFWRHINEGYTAGAALMQAKIDLAREMHKRQGFLDSEDQKTLISFLLIGDPLAGGDFVQKDSKGLIRSGQHSDVKTICDRQVVSEPSKTISPSSMKEVKRLLEKYLPGLDNAELLVCQENPVCSGKDHRCPTAESNQKSTQSNPHGRLVVTVAKQVEFDRKKHHHFLRVTLNHKGKVVKLAISR